MNLLFSFARSLSLPLFVSCICRQVDLRVCNYMQYMCIWTCAYECSYMLNILSLPFLLLIRYLSATLRCWLFSDLFNGTAGNIRRTSCRRCCRSRRRTSRRIFVGCRSCCRACSWSRCCRSSSRDSVVIIMIICDICRCGSRCCGRRVIGGFIKFS